MRRLVVVSAALLIAACGPDPNAVLPGTPKVSNSGGTKPAPAGGAGGTTTTPPSSGGTTGNTSVPAGGNGGANPFAGSPGSSGGVTSSGGVKSSGGAAGGATGAAGSSAASTTYTWGVGSEPCASPKDLSCGSGSGNTGNFGNTKEFCFRTADTIDGWGCPNNTGWTLLVNGQPTTCAGTLPARLNGLYYFDFIGAAGAVDYASMYWYGTCKAGPYPSWSGGSSTSAGGSSGAGGKTGTGGSAGGSSGTADASTGG